VDDLILIRESKADIKIKLEL